MSKIRVHDVKYDTTFKILFGDRADTSRTTDFLNVILGLEGNGAIESLTFLEGSRHGLEERSVYFDLSLDCLCISREKKRFIVEMQKANVLGHINRWIYYASRELANVGRELHDANSGIIDAAAKAKAKQHYYSNIEAVKVVCIMNFDSETLARQLQNQRDVVVHWGICEMANRTEASPLMSWTFVVLPRFDQILRNMEPIDLRQNLAYPWLYLLTRSEGEEVELNEEICAGNEHVKQSFIRLSSLSPQELSSLSKNVDQEATYLGSLAHAEEAGRQGEQLQTVRRVLGKRKDRSSTTVKDDLEAASEASGLSIDDVTAQAVEMGYHKDP